MADIRSATEADFPRLLELALLMHGESPRFQGFAFLSGRFEKTLRTVMAMPMGLLIVAEHEGRIVGGMMAVASPHYACDLVQASDLALFVDPAQRGGSAAARLVKAYLQWAKAMGAEPNIGLNTGVEPERTARLLGALGAKQTGTIWTWRT